jgi:hydroxymethylpyrimidine/phosphomethylpyrimidine kinase
MPNAYSLTIAGSDPSSGAGIQADIRTFDRCGVHPFSVITAITYQSTKEFYGYKSLSGDLENQLMSILNNYPVEFVKIGMIPDVESLNIIVNYIKKFKLKVIYDPITISSAGERLASDDIEAEIENRLLPNVKILTPNISEAEVYSGIDLNSESIDNVKNAANILLKKMYESSDASNIEKAVIIKSATNDQDEIFDVALINKEEGQNLKPEFKIFKKSRVSFSGNVHGTGCVYSSAITAFLARGNPIVKAITKAEEFFDEKFQHYIEFSDEGKVLDLTIPEERIAVINQIKEIYNHISNIQKFSDFVPEVRLNISCSLPNATSKQDIAGIEGRITIINGYPKASGEIKFGVSDHTARLILTAKKFDKTINLVMNLKYKSQWINLIQEKTNLELYEFIRKAQPKSIQERENSTMQWLIKESVEKFGKIPDIIWDKGSIGKEPIIRVFGKNSKDMIEKLQKIISACL